MKRGVDPSSAVPCSMLALCSTSNRTTSRCPFWAAMKRGVDRLSVVPCSMLALCSTSNRTTSKCPSWDAMKRGVDPSSVVPCSMLALFSTSTRTTSMCPFWAAPNIAVIPSSVLHWSLLAPASSSKSTHLGFPLHAAAYRGVTWWWWIESSKLGLRGSFKCCWRSLSLFSSHATIMPWSCSTSGCWNSRMTSCTTWRVKIWSAVKVWWSSSGQLSWRSRSRKRGMPIFCATRCFKAFTEPSANSPSSMSKTAIDSPVTAERTSSIGQLLKRSLKPETNLNHILYWFLKHLEPKVVAWESCTLRTAETTTTTTILQNQCWTKCWTWLCWTPSLDMQHHVVNMV